MNNFEFDLVIVGGGCIGSSTLHELVRAGYQNIALIDNGRKSVSATANSGGMLRVFHENPEHVELALGHYTRLKKYKLLGVLNENLPSNGNLYFFNRHRFGAYTQSLQKMDNADYPFEVITTAQGKERFPQFNWGPEDWAIYESEGGHLSPSHFVENLLGESLRRGAFLLDNFEVRRIVPYLDRFRICGENSVVTTKVLLLAGGARLLPVLRDLGVALPLESKLLTSFIAEKTTEDFVMQNFFDRETLEYGRFGVGNQVLLSQKDILRTREKNWKKTLKKQMAEDCYAPHRLGFLGQVPGHPGLHLSMGWGGTAFKFSLEVGRRVSNIVMSEYSVGRSNYAQL